MPLGGGGGRDVRGGARHGLALISNEVMIGETEWAGHLAAMASEEMEGIYPVPAAQRRGKYLLVFDPLDGSGGLDANMPAGTIFSVLAQPDPGAGRGPGISCSRVRRRCARASPCTGRPRC